MSTEPNAPERLPLFLLNTVLFPGGRLPLRVFEARYMDMARDCLKRKRPFGVCLIREGREVGAPASHEALGTLADITDCDMPQLGVLQLQTLGGQCFRVLETSTNNQGLVSASVEMVPANAELPLPDEFSVCARVLRMIIADHGEGVFAPPHRFDSAAWVGYRLSEVLPLAMQDKQQLLAMNDSVERLTRLRLYLEERGASR